MYKIPYISIKPKMIFFIAASQNKQHEYLQRFWTITFQKKCYFWIIFVCKAFEKGKEGSPFQSQKFKFLKIFLKPKSRKFSPQDASGASYNLKNIKNRKKSLRELGEPFLTYPHLALSWPSQGPFFTVFAIFYTYCLREGVGG